MRSLLLFAVVSVLAITSLQSCKGKRTEKKYSFAVPPNPQPVSVIRQLHLDYLDEPLNLYRNQGRDRIRGFYLKKSDLDIIYKYGENGARIYFGFDKAKGEYHLMMTAVKADNSNHLVDNEVIDDFFPCPTYCPEDMGMSPDAKKSDLNWDAKAGVFKPIKP